MVEINWEIIGLVGSSAGAIDGKTLGFGCIQKLFYSKDQHQKKIKYSSSIDLFPIYNFIIYDHRLPGVPNEGESF